MKKQYLLALSALLVVFAIGVMLIVRLVRPDPGTRFSRALASALSSGQLGVHLRDLPGPEWEDVYTFGPYTTQKEIHQTLGFAWQGRDGRVIEKRDGAWLLLFVRKGEVVMSTLHRRDQGDFSGVASGSKFPRTTAEFTVVRHPVHHWLALRPRTVPQTNLPVAGPGGIELPAATNTTVQPVLARP